MAFMYDQRPTICPDKTCRFVCASFDLERFEEGSSFYCIGQLEKPNVVTFGATVHDNNLCHCIYTPLKGIIKFLANEEDFELEIKLYNMALKMISDKAPVVRRV